MAKVSFSKSVENPSAPVVEAEVVTPATEIPSQPVNQALTLCNPTQPLALAPKALPWDDEKINIKDIYLPRVNLVHNTGKLMEIFNPGDVVLNATLSIHTPAQPKKNIAGTPPLNITVLGIVSRRFVEKKKQNSEDSERGLMVNSEQEVHEAGGTTDYREWQARYKANLANPQIPALRRFENYDTILVLIEKPAHVPDEEHLIFSQKFTENGVDRYFALALWGTKGTAWTHFTKHVFTEKRNGALREGYATRSWDVSTSLESFRGIDSPVWCPKGKIGPVNSLEFITFIKGVLGCAV